MTFKISDRVQIEVEENNEATITWCDFQQGQVGHIHIDGSELAVVSKCNKKGKTTSFILDMIHPNVLVRPLPLECDEVGNVL